MIGIISRTEGEGSGAEIMLCHLLSNWNNACPLIVITARNSSVARTAKTNGIPLIELAFVPEKIWPNLKTVERCLRSLRGLTRVHAWNAKSFELAWYIAKRRAVPLTCTMHDHPRSHYFTPKKLWLLKKIANASQGLVAVSNILAQECKANGYTCNIATIHNGLPDAEEEKTKKAHPVHIGFLGMNAAGKGFAAVRHWIEQTASMPGVHWHLYGTVIPQLQPSLTALKEAGYSNFTAWGRQQPEVIFQQIDILVHASTMFDCYPTVLLEAARMGVPAVASSKGGAVEIVQHGGTGFLFDPSAPAQGLAYLKNLLTDTQLYLQFSTNAAARFRQQFRIPQMVARYKDFWTAGRIASPTKKSAAGC